MMQSPAERPSAAFPAPKREITPLDMAFEVECLIGFGLRDGAVVMANGETYTVHIKREQLEVLAALARLLHRIDLNKDAVRAALTSKRARR